MFIGVDEFIGSQLEISVQFSTGEGKGGGLGNLLFNFV